MLRLKLPKDIEKLNVGCGKDTKKGFLNIDIMDLPGVDICIDAANLSGFKANSFKVIFCHSFFEHLYIYQQKPFLRECRRILKDDGYLVILGIPNFAKISECYSNFTPAQPTFGTGFSLYQAYRLTHGDFEDGKSACIPQMHKALFDREVLEDTFEEMDWASFVVFNYDFPGEKEELSLGVVAFKQEFPDQVSIKDCLLEFAPYIENIDKLCGS
jgi:predicted SAM-dependent methyltransferase